MTRIDFYVLSSRDLHGRRLMACRLTEKAYRLGHRVYLLVPSAEDVAVLDDLLWSFRQNSFVPHVRSEGNHADDDTPVFVGHGRAPDFLSDVLINLTDRVPESFERFARLAELVDQDEAVRQAGRTRYRLYKEQGYAPRTHHLDVADEAT